MKGPPDIVAVYAPRLRDLTFEEFHVVARDTQHGIERSVCVSRGTLSSTSVDARNVFRAEIEAVAAAIVLVHNHPSGDPTPSPEDRQFTMQLAIAGRLINIPIYDHIIIGREGFVSFLEQQWL